MVKPIPDGYHALTPGFAVRGAAQAIDFYERAFGSKERMRSVEDPFGQKWTLATHKEDVPPAEMDKRAQAFYAKAAVAPK